MGKNLCRTCGKKPGEVELAFMPRALCQECFIENIERRIRKNVRQNSLIKPYDRIKIKDDKTINGIFLREILVNLSKNIPIKIITTRPTRTFIPLDILDCNVLFMINIIFSEKNKIPKNPIDIVHPKEIRLFLKFKKIISGKEKEYTEKTDKITENLLLLEKKYPALLFGIRKSILSMS